MRYKEQIQAYFAAHRQEMIEDVANLVRIPSVRGEALPGKPFGEAPATALAAALERCEAFGFATRNYENYVGTADMNTEETQLAILAHLDVVPEGTGWTVCDPYTPTVVDGKIYGRGTADDKGPAIASLYAMRAIKEMGIPLKKNVRLILGTDEESGSSDLAYYFTQEKAPPMSFSPDADYPVINTEKGGLRSGFSARWEEDASLPRIVQMQGGHTANIVPQAAYALVEGMDCATALPYCKTVEERTGARFTLGEENGLLRIDVLGESAHAATPHKGNNAALALAEALASLPLAPSASARAIAAIAHLFPHSDCAGKAIGVAMEDALSGALTLNIGILNMDRTSLNGQIDSRVPVCGNEENMSKVVEARLAQEGITLEKTQMNPPHHTPEDSPLVQTLLTVYEEYTGRKGECIAIGGGTYVHHIEGGVAFGCSFPEVDNRLHGPDEFMSIDDLVVSAEMFTQIILDICG